MLHYHKSTHLTRCPDEQLENPLLVGSVHTLVDLVHTAEGDGGQLLEGEHVQRCCHASLTPGLYSCLVSLPKYFVILYLVVGSQPLQRLSVPVLHHDVHTIVFEVILKLALVQDHLKNDKRS